MSIEGSLHIGRARTAEGKLLRGALNLDAAVTGANAVAYAGGAALLSGWLGVPTAFLIAVGVCLAAYAVGVRHLATRRPMPVPAVWAVIALNVAWAVDSVALLALDGFSPTLAGQLVVAVQAVGVLGFAALQYAGLRRG